MGLLTGTHTLQVSYGGPDRQRVAVLAQLAERDVIRNGADLWTYDSITGDVTHNVLPTRSRGSGADGGMVDDAVTPPEAARQLLAAIDPTTRVTVDRTARVAGRPAYQLVLQPRQSGVLIRSVRIALDSATSLPLRYQVFGTGSKPAVDIGFTSITFAAPKARTFAFTPPRGSHVRTHAPGHASAEPATGSPDSGAPRLIGTGWTSIVELPASALPRDSAAMFKQLSVAAPGGRLVRTALLTVLRTDDGRLFVGAVTPSLIEAAAGHAG
jgi:outer membrane lipoprotein-sorting protein